MADQWAQFKDADSDPWGRFADAPAQPSAKPKRKKSMSENVSGFMANVNRGTGIGDELAAAGNVMAGIATGRHRFGADKPGNVIVNNLAMVRDAYETELAGQRRSEDEFTAERPKTAALARGTGMAAAAAVPAGATAQGGNALMQIARGATVGATGGYAGGLADRGNLQERVKAANTGAVVGGVLGGTISAIGVGRNALAEAAQRRQEPVNQLSRYARQDPAQLRANADEMRANGFESPALVDVVDESGRGVIRGTASRSTPARQATRDFAEGRAMDLPDRMSRQARRVMSDDPRTPMQIADELGAARREAGNVQFGAVRGERVGLSDDAVMALRSPDGRSAIRSAAQSAMRSIDPDDRALAAELNRLADEVLDAPGQVQITVGMSQNISESLFDAADKAARSGANREAKSLGDLARAIRDNARTNVAGYDEALTNYAAQSRMIESAERGGDFLSRNTDEFVADVGAMGPDENALARATGRRAIERAAGENISAAPGVARRIALAPEQQARNEALLGPEGAEALQAGMATEARAVQNAADINPRTGSQTQPRGADAARISERLQDVAAAGQAFMGRPMPAIQRVLQRVGINDQQAQAITELAIDPSRLDEAIRILEQRGLPHQQAVEVVQSLRISAGAGFAAGQSAGPAQPPMVPGQ